MIDVMYKWYKILVAIPARWGSQWIPKKNIKLLNGKPLISYVIETAQNSNYVDEIVVTTDDELIVQIAQNYWLTVHKRHETLAQPSTPLDPVIVDVMEKYPEFSHVITLQPTSPLLTVKTLDTSIENRIDNNKDTLISLREETHLYRREENGNIVPDYFKRVNRQQLPKKYVETWAIIGCKTNYLLQHHTRINPDSCDFTIMSIDESIDIDNFNDWNLVASILTRRTIWINVIWNHQNGMWHLYRQLQIAQHLNVKPIFLVPEGNDLARKKIEDAYYQVVAYNTPEDLFNILIEKNISLLINDILNTKKEDILLRKKTWVKVINFEDLGSWKIYADTTINAMYELSWNYTNMYHGNQYILIRQDVVDKNPITINDTVQLITISCWWTDPNNMTLKYLKVLRNLDFWWWLIRIILWPWYWHKNSLHEYIGDELKSSTRIDVVEDVNSMWELLSQSDIVLTSNWRTIYEAAALWIPTISMCQNEQELTHTFWVISWCIIQLWLIDSVNDEDLLMVCSELINSKELRMQKHQEMLAHDFKNGINRVLEIIYSV